MADTSGDRGADAGTADTERVGGAADAGAAGGGDTAARWARAVGVAIYLGGFGYLLIVLWQGAIANVAGLDDSATAAWQLSSQLAVFMGGATLAAFFLRTTGRGLDYLDLRLPTARELAVVVGGVVALLGINVVAEFAGVPTASHSVEESVRGNPEALLAMAVGGVLFVGPGEELLYRNVVQKVTAERLGTPAAIAVASVVFAAVHTFAFLGAPLPAFLSTLGVVGVLSIVLGAIYAYTRSLPVVALVHGLYDAVAFVTLYWEMAG